MSSKFIPNIRNIPGTKPVPEGNIIKLAPDAKGRGRVKGKMAGTGITKGRRQFQNNNDTFRKAFKALALGNDKDKEMVMKDHRVRRALKNPGFHRALAGYRKGLINRQMDYARQVDKRMDKAISEVTNEKLLDYQIKLDRNIQDLTKSKDEDESTTNLAKIEKALINIASSAGEKVKKEAKKDFIDVEVE